MKTFTVAILGCGNRGAESYGEYMFDADDKYKITALCDIKPTVLDKFAKKFGVDESELFTDENEFFKSRRADVLVVATLDKDHIRHCLKAMELGYDVLLEKPITDSFDECKQLLAAHKKYGGKVLVCHVLRYAPAFMKIDELIRSGAIGRLVSIQALEQVAYWHQAHSYVRGNWRKSEDTTPMILAKCCHDLDLIQHYAGAKCESVSSVGDLTFFNAANAPEGCADRCTDCKLVSSCPYSAERLYIDAWKAQGSPEECWPYSVLTSGLQKTTEAALRDAIERGPYGRCVFRCDNDVVDHQLTQMTFENGVKATLVMTAFTKNGGRKMTFFGTLGEIVLDEEGGVIEVKPFGAPSETIYINSMRESGHAHGGGDKLLVEALYDVLCGDDCATTLEASVESHLMGICAERSRKNGGALVRVHD